MTAQQISVIAGIILSLGFSYIPGLADWFAAKPGTTKRLVMLGLLFVGAGGAFGLACLGWGGYLGIVIQCDAQGAIGLFTAFIAAAIANQTTFAISPKVNYAERKARKAHKANQTYADDERA